MFTRWDSPCAGVVRERERWDDDGDGDGDGDDEEEEGYLQFESRSLWMEIKDVAIAEEEEFVVSYATMPSLRFRLCFSFIKLWAK